MHAHVGVEISPFPNPNPNPVSQDWDVVEQNLARELADIRRMLDADDADMIAAREVHIADIQSMISESGQSPLNPR